MNGRVSGARDLIPWLRAHLAPEDLIPDRCLGFTTLEEEVTFAEKLVSMLRNPFTFRDESKENLSFVLHGDEHMSAQDRNRLIEDTVAALDKDDEIENKLIGALKKGLRGCNAVARIALSQTQL